MCATRSAVAIELRVAALPALAVIGGREHAVADIETADAGAELVDHPRGIETDDVREHVGAKRREHALAVLPVGGVHAGVGHADTHFAGARLGRGDLAVLQDLGATGLVDDHRKHGVFSCVAQLPSPDATIAGWA